jgi:LacI family transcriptional regulator
MQKEEQTPSSKRVKRKTVQTRDGARRIRRRRERPLVVLSLPSADQRAMHAMVELARELEWDLVDLEITGGVLLSDRQPAGALVNHALTGEFWPRLQKRGCPIVRYGSWPHELDDGLPSVLLDQVEMGCIAADHFAGRGFKNVAYGGRGPTNPDNPYHPMIQAFQQRGVELGISVDFCTLKPGKGKKESSAERVERHLVEFDAWIAGLPKPIGIFSFSDAYTTRLCALSMAAGLRVPEEVALLSMGNSHVCELSPVPLSAIDSHVDEKGRQSLLLLQRLMRGEDAPTKPIMISPSGVIERRSTDLLAVADPRVAKAMRFMWDHLDRDLSVDQVAHHVGVARNTIERAFKRSLDRSVNAELHRRRLTELCRLLLSTDDPIVDLAPQVGFRTMAHLHRSFRKAYNMTPRQYRLQGMAAKGR